MTIPITETRSSRMPTKRRRRRAQPSKPRELRGSEIAVLRPRPEDWGVNEEAIRLEANENVTTSRDFGGRMKRVMRYDVFGLLFYMPNRKRRDGTPIQRLSETSYDAVRRLQADMAILHRTQGTCDTVRSTGPGATGALALVSDRFGLTRVLAGQKVALVLDGGQMPNGRWHAGMTPWCAKLMRALAEQEVIRGQTPNWHAIVTKHTGETDRHRRGELVRQACDDLAESYRRIDNEPKERVA